LIFFSSEPKGGREAFLAGKVRDFFPQILRAKKKLRLRGKGKGKGKAVPLQAWRDPEGSSKLMFPDFVTTAQDCGKFVSPTHRPPLPPGNTPGTHFC